jgi:hypothetical protein
MIIILISEVKREQEKTNLSRVDVSGLTFALSRFLLYLWASFRCPDGVPP